LIVSQSTGHQLLVTSVLLHHRQSVDSHMMQWGIDLYAGLEF